MAWLWLGCEPPYERCVGAVGREDEPPYERCVGAAGRAVEPCELDEPPELYDPPELCVVGFELCELDDLPLELWLVGLCPFSGS